MERMEASACCEMMVDASHKYKVVAEKQSCTSTIELLRWRSLRTGRPNSLSAAARGSGARAMSSTATDSMTGSVML